MMDRLHFLAARNIIKPDRVALYTEQYQNVVELSRKLKDKMIYNILKGSKIMKPDIRKNVEILMEQEKEALWRIYYNTERDSIINETS
ncbi:hypothetical protein SAMN04487772_10925 [[Clostridium] polysaccharolyticum]|uniref:Uncharacterized protein n=1 Tax=[Clostridium] polysaccharolyticum TaxID=29364 RepID=A0A1I0C581_9FIRM|nr:hypothetical protein SAMN04487772_10925 [[Clostridium] polysaccharolyticum]